MRPSCLAALLAVAVVISPRPSPAKAPALADDFSDKLISFDEVLEEIHKLEESGDWKAPGWKPRTISTWLNHLVAEVKRASKREELKLPVGFDKVKPAIAQPGLALGTQQAALHVVKDGKFSFLRQSIVLADGSVEASLAEGCIIIARGAVTLSSSQNNLIVGGHFVSVSSDRPNSIRVAAPLPIPNGPAPAAPPAAEGANQTSVIFSAGILDINMAYGTICCGLDRVVLSYTQQGAMVLNSPNREAGVSARFEAIGAPQVPFTRNVAKNPLEGKLEITQVVPGTTGHLIVQRGGVEYVIRPGATATDERGQPLTGMENWKLNFLGRNYALFANGRQYAGFYAKR
jgi:hypothetical protein